MHLMAFSESDTSPSRLWWRLGALAAVVLVGTVLARSVFFVDETEYAYVTQFGEPVRLHTESGLGFKWPYQSLWRFDRRLQIFEPPAREMLTADKENLNFEWFVCWRIPGESFFTSQNQPGGGAAQGVTESGVAEEIEQYVRRFLQAVGTIEAAESRLEERIQAALAAEVGQTRLDQLVALEPAQVQLEPIMRRVTESVGPGAAQEFGIEVVEVLLKRFNYPEAVKPAVYAEIRSERERVAVQYRAEGASEKTRIESLADLQRDQLLAQARRDATAIRGEGEAKAIEVFNAAHSKNPRFYELLKTLETYRGILDDQTTVVLAADSPLLKLLTRGLPNLTEQPPEFTTAGPGSSDQPHTPDDSQSGAVDRKGGQ